MQRDEASSFDTLAVHGGIRRGEFGPVTPPIFQTSAFSFESAEKGASLFSGAPGGYIYTRMGNPTVEALEQCVAELEGGHAALACASGMAAIHTTLAGLLKQGDHLICSEAVYGPTCTLIESHLAKFGIEATFVATSEVDDVKRAVRQNTSVIYVETPGNPTLVITDLEEVSQIARRCGAVLVVDNTLMSPVLQQPLKWGADIVVHSMTKFLNGHADVIGGVIVVDNQARYEHFREVLNHLGGVLSPFESFLVHRGIKTLVLRMRRQCDSALAVAEFLDSHPLVQWVRYPGLQRHPQYDIARKQMTGAGAIICFGMRGGLEAGRKLMNAVKLCTLGVSLGGVETLIQHPASMTHASMGREARERAGITDGLVRISVGIEDVGELIADLKGALDVTETKWTPKRQAATCP